MDIPTTEGKYIFTFNSVNLVIISYQQFVFDIDIPNFYESKKICVTKNFKVFWNVEMIVSIATYYFLR